MSRPVPPGALLPFAGKQRAEAAFDVLEQELAGLPVDGLPGFLGALTRLEVAGRLRLTLPRFEAREPSEDRLIEVKEAAGRLGISTSQLYKTADEFPFTVRRGRVLRFSSLGIDRWIAKRTR